ncbi:MAG: HNH endonuclease [Bacilli bacterium]|nr:HNH endonuclease [Bacilli bacterium]
MAYPWAKAFYNSSAWKDMRRLILMRDHYRCTEPSCHRTAEEVHHIKELTKENVNDNSIALNPNNLRSLCGDCHKRITKREKMKSNKILIDIIFDDDGYPIPAGTPRVPK